MVFKYIPIAALLLSTITAHCTRNYVVQGGEICDSISQSHNVSTYQLAAVNFDKINDDCSNLEKGEELCLGWPSTDCNETYTVQKGDTCDLIAYNNKINTTVLWFNNPQINNECSNVYVGEVLCVHNGIQVPEYRLPDDAPVHTINDCVDWSNSPVANEAPIDDYDEGCQY